MIGGFVDKYLNDCIPKSSIKGWNQTARDCFYLKCNCQKCRLYKFYFELSADKCKMKYYVLKLVEKLGIPLKNEK